jgi:protein involved in polysaccharide export with SLBB domain
MLMALAPLLGGCSHGTSAQWIKNGLLDPTQVGNFEKSVSTEIRESISILEEPTGIQTAEEPNADDMIPRYTEERISPGDILNVSMFEVLTPGVSTGLQVRVGNSGFETFPMVGQVRVVGLTPRELELELKEQLRGAGILQDADVQVSLVQSQSTQFSVVGNVARPNIYPLPRPNLTVLDCLAAAGGIPPQVEKIYVFRAQHTWPMLKAAEPGATTKVALAKELPTVPFSMSDTSSGRSAWTSEPPPEGETPATSKSVVDELDILEGQPTTEMAAPQWDAERGEWVVEKPATKPTATAVQEGQTRPVASDRVMTTTSEAVSVPAGQGEQPEGEPLDKAKELAPPLRVIEIPVKELLDGDPRYNIYIRPFDTINVPAGSVGEYYLGGNVTRPGAYALTGRRITVKQAIVSAGGFGPLAWPSRAEVVRRVSKDEEQTIQLDLDAIFAGSAPDFYVKPNDIINVGTNAATVFMAVLRNAFRFSYGLGFVYDRNFADSDTFDAKQQLKAEHRQERVAKGLPAY